MRRIETYGEIRDGKLKIIHRKIFIDSFKLFKNGRIKLILERVYKHRSNPQNAYLWGVVYPIVLQGLQEVGYNEIRDIDQVHNFCKSLFLKKKIVNEYTGKSYIIVGSTKELTTIQFEEYLEEIRQFASEYLHHYIPEPNEEMQEYKL